MSCPTATAPIDISMSKITGKCDLKCSYNFNYNNSSCLATNRGNYISISYDKSSSPPVLYNTLQFDVKEIRLYIPSLHSYNDSKTDGELIIVHTSNTGAMPLLVCIPIKRNNTSSTSALFFNNIINTVASSAPSEDESTNVNIPNFNLNLLVPKKPFFSYSATEPYQPCTENVNYIVFNSSLDITSNALTKLQSIIQSNPYDIKTGPNLFYNDKGSTSRGSDFNSGDIYIDCQPVGSTNETTEIVTDMGNNSITLKDLLNNPFVKLFLGSLLFITILFVIKYLLNMLKPTTKGGTNNYFTSLQNT
jgi:carbonic anhydrase